MLLLRVEHTYPEPQSAQAPRSCASIKPRGRYLWTNGVSRDESDSATPSYDCDLFAIVTSESAYDAPPTITALVLSASICPCYGVFWISSTRSLGACGAPNRVLCISTLCETVRLVPCTVTIIWDNVSILSGGGAHPTNALSSIYFPHGTSRRWPAPPWS